MSDLKFCIDELFDMMIEFVKGEIQNKENN